MLASGMVTDLNVRALPADALIYAIRCCCFFCLFICCCYYCWCSCLSLLSADRMKTRRIFCFIFFDAAFVDSRSFIRSVHIFILFLFAFVLLMLLLLGVCVCVFLLSFYLPTKLFLHSARRSLFYMSKHWRINLKDFILVSESYYVFAHAANLFAIIITLDRF